MNRVVEDTLRTCVNHNETGLDTPLPLWQFAMILSSFFPGEFPFFLSHSQHPLTPRSVVDLHDCIDISLGEGSPHVWLKVCSEAIAITKDALEAAKPWQAFYTDKRRKNITFQVTDLNILLVNRDFLVTPGARN